MPPCLSALRPVLIVDDTDDDLCLMRRYLMKAGVMNPIRTFDDSLRARDYLTAAINPPNPELLPCVVFSDLRMPKMTGIELLTWVRANPEFNSVKFVVVSTSSHDLDQASARAAGADDYLVKFPPCGRLAELIPKLPTTPQLKTESNFESSSV